MYMKRFAGLVAILILTMHEGLAGNFASERSDEVVFHVSAPTRITPEDAAPHFWWRLRASPSSPEHMILCAIRNEPETAKALQNIIYGSTDGGRSWSLLMEDSGYATSSEAECAIDGDNHIYFVSSRSGDAWNPKEKPPNDSFAFKSKDNGQTWMPSERIPYYLDSTIILVGENRRHKKKKAAIYFNNLGKDIKGASGAIIHSTDGAHTFSPPAAFPAPPGRSRNAYGWFMTADCD